MRIVGYTTSAGQRTKTVLPKKREVLLHFLEAHLFDDEVVLTDSADRLIFRAADGIDLYSRLDEFGIDLPTLYRRLRQAAVPVAPRDEGAREPWEDLYDSIGLSPGEIAMRQRVKRAAKAARTASDVAELLAGTYFDASFESGDGSRSWAGFDPGDLSVVGQLADDGTGERIRLPPDARVRHRGSGEDVHCFVLLDSPPPRATGPG
ncbi:MAG: hypothetical protein ABIJ48_05775 [Actinomycetota bacterium]